MPPARPIIRDAALLENQFHAEKHLRVKPGEALSESTTVNLLVDTTESVWSVVSRKFRTKVASRVSNKSGKPISASMAVQTLIRISFLPLKSAASLDKLELLVTICLNLTVPGPKLIVYDRRRWHHSGDIPFAKA